MKSITLLSLSAFLTASVVHAQQYIMAIDSGTPERVMLQRIDALFHCVARWHHVEIITVIVPVVQKR